MKKVIILIYLFFGVSCKMHNIPILKERLTITLDELSLYKNLAKDCDEVNKLIEKRLVKLNDNFFYFDKTLFFILLETDCFCNQPKEIILSVLGPSFLNGPRNLDYAFEDTTSLGEIYTLNYFLDSLGLVISVNGFESISLF